MTVFSVLSESASGGSLRNHPYEWHVNSCGIASAVASQMAATLPSTGWVHDASEEGRLKSYSMLSRPFIDFGATKASDDLPELWAQLAGDLLTPEYRSWVGRLTGLSLNGAPLEARLWRYERGHWLGPHTDTTGKIVSQIFYFARQWDPRWGGCLQILGSASPDDVVFEVPPTRGTVATIVRSDCSWHAVRKVAVHSRAPRRDSLQVVFYHPDARPRRTAGAL